MKHLNALFRVLLVLAFATTGAFAFSAEVDAPEPPTIIVALLSEPIEVVFDTDLSALNENEWSGVSEVLESYVTSPNSETVEYALRTMIHFAEQYGKASEFSNASWELYQIYRFSPNESHRLMAIQALAKVSNETVMRNVAHNIGAIKSPQLRHAAKAAVNDFFGDRNQ